MGRGALGFPSCGDWGLNVAPPPPAPAGPVPPWLPGLARVGGAGMWGAGGATPLGVAPSRGGRRDRAAAASG
eukprot:8679007-Alexandrium_andersonii.AAC.1